MPFLSKVQIQTIADPYEEITTTEDGQVIVTNKINAAKRDDESKRYVISFYCSDDEQVITALAEYIGVIDTRKMIDEEQAPGERYLEIKKTDLIKINRNEKIRI